MKEKETKQTKKLKTFNGGTPGAKWLESSGKNRR